ncbi:hypothetical protein GW931_02780 [archaeon]|nr:hypothetical protein [archaeon]
MIDKRKQELINDLKVALTLMEENKHYYICNALAFAVNNRLFNSWDTNYAHMYIKHNYLEFVMWIIENGEKFTNGIYSYGRAWDCDDISIKIRMLKKFIKKLER